MDYQVMQTLSADEFIQAQPKAVLSAIAKANLEHTKATSEAVNALEAKQSAIKHAIACGKALMKVKERVGHGGWEGLFSRQKHGSDGGKNPCFSFSQLQAQRYLKVASYPTLARQAMIEDQSERFNLDRTI
jgi:hypothetical protein